MSGLIGDLLSNAGALSAHSRAVETTGRNIANVNDPEYARQRVILGDFGSIKTTLGAQSMGLQALRIEHLRSVFLDRQVMRETIASGSLEAQNQINQWLETALGEQINRLNDSPQLDGGNNDNTSPSGLSKSINDFFNSFQQLAASPDEPGSRLLVIQGAEVLVDNFHTLADRFSSLDADIVDLVNADKDKANNLLDKIANLNTEIKKLELNKPNTAVDLRDQRQGAIEDLAKIMSIEVRLNVGTGNNLQIVTKDSVGSDVIMVEGRNVYGAVDFDGTNINFGTPPVNLDLTGGSLYGYLEARNTTLTPLRSDLDDMAEQIVTSVNLAYNPGATPDNFFDPTGITAATIQIDSGLNITTLKATDTGASGANELALAVAQVADQQHSTGGGDVIDGNFIEFYGGVTANLGEIISGTEAKLETQQLVGNAIKGQRDSLSGVSLDEEMTDLVRFQRAFQSTARVISVIDQMLQTLVQTVRR